MRHTFRQGEQPVERVLKVALHAALGRQRKLTVVCKEAGLPDLHALWRDVTNKVTAGTGVETEFLDIDYAVYKLSRHFC